MSDTERFMLFDGHRIVGETDVPLENFKVTRGMMATLVTPFQIKIKRKPQGNKVWLMFAGQMAPNPIVIDRGYLTNDTVNVTSLSTGLGLSPRGF